MGKVSLIIIFLIFSQQLNVKAQNAGGSQNNTGNKKANSLDKKPLREYTRYDTIFKGYSMPVAGHKLKYDRPVRDTRGNTYLISDKTEEIVKFDNGIWRIWNKGISGKVFYLYADAKGNVFAHTKEKKELYQLKDSVWVKISDNFLFRQLIPGADGQLYSLENRKDANGNAYYFVQVWDEDQLKPLERNSSPRLFYEETMKIYITENGTVFLTGQQKVNDVMYLVLYEWKNAQWKKIGEFADKYVASAEKGFDKQNRFYVSYYKDDLTLLRRWDGNTWTAAPLPRSPIKYLSLSNNLTGELFCKVNFPKPQEDYQLQGEEWIKLVAEPAHIIPKYMKEVYPQMEGHYYKTEYGYLYDLGTEFTVRKRNLKEYPFVIPASMEKIISTNIKEHLTQFRLLEDNGKVGLASGSSDYEIIHAVFDSIRVEKNYMSETEYKEYGYTEYQPFVLVLYKDGKSIDVNILAVKPRPFKSDQILEGTITRINTCRKCNGTGTITERTIKSYTPEKTDVVKIKDRYKSASGDLVEKTYSWMERTPSVTTFDIKSGPCTCRGGKIENTIQYYFDIEKQYYRN